MNLIKRILRITPSMIIVTAFMVGLSLKSHAQNPVIRSQFSADPSARVFNGKVYLFPSHDILGKAGQGKPGWFCMEDYHVFSSQNLNDWTDHGVIIRQNEIPWVKKESYSMWAPDCIYRNGKYYFYFPTTPKDTTISRGFTIGVAVADQPEGPYVPEPFPIKNVRGIDPNVFIDKDGQAYLYWSAGDIFGAKLKSNMLELASEPVVLSKLPEKGLKEGPYMIERNGTYYLTYPHVENKIERLEYATGTSPLGPFTFAGVIMDESPSGCWTNHHSLIQYNDQWYLFYHHNDYSPKFDKNRSVRVDSMSFLSDGTIKKVIPTLRGVGLTNASSKIQLDRYSRISDAGAAINLLDSANAFQGWKVIFNQPGAWVQYNAVDFTGNSPRTLVVNARSSHGATLTLRLGHAAGPVVAEIKIPKTVNWKEISVPLANIKTGVNNIVVALKEQGPMELDWISFR